MDKGIDQADSAQELTDFGFQRIAKQQKKQRVAQVFNSVATRYDVMNDVMSLGLHRLWKRFTIGCSGVHPGHTVLDLAGGTGDLALQFAHLVGPTGKVILADINHTMLTLGRAKLQDQGLIGPLHYVQADAESLPFPDDCFDCISMAFGLRNVTDKAAALRSIWRVLKPGGRLLVLEFSKPLHPGLSKLYDFYSLHLLPKLGQWIAQDSASYRYLAESIRRHPDQQALKQQLQQAGFEQIDYFNLSGGIVALHRGYKF